ncbi:MAG TPA: AAA family ATPase [Methylomirabilota bacterium]|nr:AAA family ATPase [Methylomirabilota bacterium]
MYTEHFGLTELPFSLTPDPRYVYMSDRHREALAHLIYGISQGDGFVQLTGEVGTGKTTMCRCLLEQLPADVDVALIFNPRLTSHELLAAVCDELRVVYPAGTTSVKLLVDSLYRHLLAAHERGRRTVLIIDEAQNLSVDVLEQVRLLTNLETARDKLLQIILIGQTELGALLERPELRQLAQRVTARYHLRPFTHEETRAYIIHRLGVAGRTRLLFSPWALREVHRLSRGVPRLINVICDRALLGAYANSRSWVDVHTVRRAAREVRGVRMGARRLPWVAALAALTGLAAVLLTSDRLTDFFRPPELPRDMSTVAVVASTEVPPASVVNGAVAEQPRAAGLEIPLEEVLVSPSMRTDRQKAFAALYARWGLRFSSGGGDACDFGRVAGLRCLARSGTWGWLRRLDLPAIIELRTLTGDRYFAAVVALDEQRATLDFGGHELTFPLGEIDRYWNGAFVLLWSAPFSSPVLVPGQRGSDVQWLRRRLGTLDGSSRVDKDGDVYDADVIRRVKAFQRSRLLTDDGVAGEETLAHLSAAIHEPGRPRLSMGPR